MTPLISDYLEADKVAETLGVNWRHEQIEDRCFDEPEIIVFDDFIFDLVKEDHRTIHLELDSEKTKKCILRFKNNQSRSEIHFPNISRVLYNPKQQIVMMESYQKDSFSHLTIDSKGGFYLSLGDPIDQVVNSSLTITAENLSLIEPTLD